MKKCNGLLELDNNHFLIYSGVENNKRTDVGCIIFQKSAQANKWETSSERILNKKN